MGMNWFKAGLLAWEVKWCLGNFNGQNLANKV